MSLNKEKELFSLVRLPKDKNIDWFQGFAQFDFEESLVFLK
jgi:hypothetical protein